ncbi:MAG: restriction endonuclease subunit S [Halobacteriota archaeon]
MISDLKPYSKYKDSGIPWLGEVPEHWEMRRTKTLLQQRVQKGFPDEPLLAATQTKGVVRKEQYENRTVLALKDLHLLKLVRVGDFVISLRSFQGGIEYAHEQGIISPAYTVLYPVQADLHGFLAWLFKSKPYVENLSLYVTGIRQGQNIDYEKLSRSELPVPPPSEQLAIFRFLDHADRKIRRYIHAKQKLIKLLEEQKQAIIHRAVTRGLDQNVHLKPSGVEWLENVPEHWEVTRLGRLIELTTGFPFKSDGFTQASDDIRLLRGINVAPGQVRWNDVVRWPLAESKKFDEYKLRSGDIVLGMDRPIIHGGVRVAVIEDLDVPSLLLQRVTRIRPCQDLRADFLILLLAGSSFSNYLTPIFTGISVPHLSPEQIKSFRFALPKLDEQQQIVELVAVDTATVQSTVERTHREISLLREYRTRLIADVVTGKLDVREAAAKLPEEAEEPEVVDEIDDISGELEETGLEDEEELL